MKHRRLSEIVLSGTVDASTAAKTRANDDNNYKKINGCGWVDWLNV
jgi:hypothetical protein